ncbi:MAG: serine protease [Planctomycetes bacterium]|nr:serine protease [Planctomycetota bacterium]
MADFLDTVQNVINGVVAIDRADGKGWGATGFVVGDGLVLTVNHALSGRPYVGLLTFDGRQLTAKKQIAMSANDLALLHVDDMPSSLEVLPLADGLPRLAESVFCIGTPYGYPFSVSKGIVSALGRSISMPFGDTIDDAIQTDACVNPGNSGGPLFNMRGEAAGMVFAQHSGAENIGFAMSTGYIRRYLDLLASANNLDFPCLA